MGQKVFTVKEKLWPIAVALLPAAARIALAVAITVLVQLGLLDAALRDVCLPAVLGSRPFGL